MSITIALRKKNENKNKNKKRNNQNHNNQSAKKTTRVSEDSGIFFFSPFHADIVSCTIVKS